MPVSISRLSHIHVKTDTYPRAEVVILLDEDAVQKSRKMVDENLGK